MKIWFFASLGLVGLALECAFREIAGLSTQRASSVVLIQSNVCAQTVSGAQRPRYASRAKVFIGSFRSEGKIEISKPNPKGIHRGISLPGREELAQLLKIK